MTDTTKKICGRCNKAPIWEYLLLYGPPVVQGYRLKWKPRDDDPYGPMIFQEALWCKDCYIWNIMAASSDVIELIVKDSSKLKIWKRAAKRTIYSWNLTGILLRFQTLEDKKTLLENVNKISDEKK